MLQDHRAHLAYLVDLGLAIVALQIDLFFNTGFPEHVMTSPYALLKSQASQ